MKKLAYVVGGIVVLIIVVALVAPFFVDLNNYKPQIEAQAKAATGRDLKIEGPISLSLLPLPSVSVSGVKFGNAPGGSAPNMAEIESATVKVAIMPLLSHRAEITNIVLAKPTIVLEKLKDGTANWQLNTSGGASTGGTTAAPAPSTAPAPAGADASAGGWDVKIDGASIQDGTLIYRDLAAGTEQKIEKFNVDLSMDSLKGPFDAKGGMVAMNLPVDFTVKAGRMDPAAPMPIDLTLGIGDGKGSFGFSGQADMAAASDATKPIVTGKLSAKAANVADLLATLTGGSAASQPPALAQSFTLDGDVTAGQQAADVKNLNLALGDIQAQGGVSAKYGAATQVDADLAVGRVDLDKLMPQPAKAGASPAASGSAPANNAAATPAAPFTLPGGITANLTATVEQIAYQGKAIDGTKLVAQLKDGQLNLSQFSAQLPGNTAFTLSGVLAPKSGQPNFTGAVKASSDNLREVADMFAKGALNSVPADRLRKLALTSRLNASPTQVEIADLNAQLDASKLSGGVIVALPDQAKRKRMAFGVGLSVDKLNIDGYLPQGGGKTAAAGASTSQASAASANAAPQNPLKALAPLGDLDANVEVKAGSLTMNSQTVSGLHALIGLADGTLDIKDLSVKDLAGGKGTITGKVTALKTDPKFDLDFDVSAKDAGKVLEMGGMGPQTPGKFGALALKGTASGNANDVSYDLSTSMTGVGLDGSAKGTANGLMAGGIPKINSTFDIKAKDTTALAQLFGGPADAAKQLGAVAFSGTAQSGADDLTYDVTLSIGGIGGSGKLAGKLTGIKSTPTVDTTLDLKADKPAPLLQLAGLAGPKAQAMGTLSVSGALKGSADDMNLNLDLAGAGATAKLSGDVKAKANPIAFDIALTAKHPEFTDLMKLADLPGTGTKGGPLDVTVKAAGTTQKAQLSQLDAKWGDSSLTGSGTYDATGAKPMIVASMTGGTVNLTPFMAPSTKPNPSKTTTGSGGSGSGGSAGAGSNSPWSTDPIDLSALGKQNAKIDLTAKSLVLPNQQIDDVTAKITIQDGLMTITTLNGKIYGGAFDLSGTTVNANGTPKVDAKVAVKAIQLAQLMGGGIAGNQVKGPLTLNFDGTTSGLSEADLVRSLNGKGNIDGTVMIIGKIEQTVGSALLGVLGQKVKAVQGVADQINGVLSSYTGVDNKLTGTFDIAQGVLNTQDTAFSNPKARGTAKGKVDLGQWAMNMLVDLFGSANADKAFMSVNLDGPVDSPKPSFSGNGAAPSTSGVPGLNIPGLNIPGVSGSGAGTNGATGTTPAPAANGIGGTAGAAIGGAVGGGSGSAVGGAAGGLINDLLGGKSKKKKDKSQNATQPAPTTEPGAGGTAAPAAPTNTQETLPLPTNNETTTEPGATGAEPGANGN
jgi:uncharacterized protein involved in outer membrane biogenesis